MNKYNVVYKYCSKTEAKFTLPALHGMSQDVEVPPLDT